MALPVRLAAGRRLLPRSSCSWPPRPRLHKHHRRCAGTGSAEDLKVLPKDWTRAQVVAVMQNFNAGLSVGCDYCHVQNPGTSNW